MKTVCQFNQCAGCMACVDICPKGAITIEEGLAAYNAVIDENKCVDCNACHKVCQRNHPAKLMSPIKWYQGWADVSDVRKHSSSGGLATAISQAFVEAGGIVCSCTFHNGEFIFEFADMVEDLKKFVGSKYVKSNPRGVYNSIKEHLKQGRKVLFTGLPCQVSALKNYVGEHYEDKLYTADLICHGTPSPKLLEIFLNQYGCSLTELRDIQFRVKSKFMVYGDYECVITNGVSDKYSIAFLNSLTYTENCYDCGYAQKARVSDITLGDSWGSELSKSEQKKGISLILCQTQKGLELIEQAKLHLEYVDIDNAIEKNHQLEKPSVLPRGRSEFFDCIAKEKSFNKLVFKLFPKQCLRQNIKEVLIKMKIIQGDCKKSL